MKDVTLQINLSPGDDAYAEQTVPALVAAHAGATERLLVVDLCKPQATRIVDPAQRYPEPAYSARQARILSLAEAWGRSGLVDRVVALRPGDELFGTLSRRYLRPWLRETHDYGGCALMAYLAAFELCRTRWLLHFDADVLIYQKPGFDWTGAAQEALARDPTIVAATPRPAPPMLAGIDAPTAHERLRSLDRPAGWLNAWCSTRCYLFDLERLRPLLPLLQGRIYWETLLARLRGRGYPRSPEIMIFRRMQAARCWRLVLRDKDSWLLHPARKDPLFHRLLPAMLDSVRQGLCPETQRGHADLDLDAWAAWLDEPAPRR